MDRSRFTPKRRRTGAQLWEAIRRALAIVTTLVLCAAGCASDNVSSWDVERSGMDSIGGNASEGIGGGSAVGGSALSGATGGGMTGVAYPPGVPSITQAVGGGINSGVICDNGKGTAKFGGRCLKSADCEPGTFRFSVQCTAICGDTQRKVGEYSAMAPCRELFGFAVCVVSAKAASIPQSIFYCTPTCAKDADCSVGATCTQGQYYKSLPTMPATYEWYDLAKVCTVN
ncbi:MAG TPA: hypothetical protein VIV60_33465 [Polyangiaceae bacterium]